jgi:hypothetical protein
MCRCKVAGTLTDVRAINPSILIDGVECLVEVTNAEIRVVSRIINNPKIAIRLQHPVAFPSPIDARLDVLVKFCGEGASLVGYSDIVVGVRKDAIHGVIREFAQNLLDRTAVEMVQEIGRDSQ